MKPKHQRLVFVAFSVVFLCVATMFTLQAFRENVVFFYTPSDLVKQPTDEKKQVRVGGLVETGSVIRNGDNLRFSVTDGQVSISVNYQGITPGLFREGQGAVIEGYWLGDGRIKAARVLTKHDEFYMPKEVVESLKKSGHWHTKTE